MNQKHIFWQALLVTIFVFGTGILLGFVIENNRTSEISKLYQDSELSLLDIRIQSEIYNLENINCQQAILENINFGDKIYEEAKLVKDYEDSSRISNSIKIQHKKYDLLRTLFWINSMKIKKACNADYHNVVYLYQYNNINLEIKAKQEVFSRVLGDLKATRGNSVMLIPIAGDMNFSSINLLKNTYGITNLPTILIDEKIKIEEVQAKEDIENVISRA